MSIKTQLPSFISVLGLSTLLGACGQLEAPEVEELKETGAVATRQAALSADTGSVVFRSVYSRMPIGVPGSSQVPNVQMTQFFSLFPVQPPLSQQFSVLDQGGGAVLLPVQHSALCLSVAGGSTADGAPIVQGSCLAPAAPLFTLSRAADGSYSIVARHSGKCVQVTGSWTSNGPLVQATCSGQPSQRFALDAYSGVSRVYLTPTEVGQYRDLGLPNPIGLTAAQVREAIGAELSSQSAAQQSDMVRLQGLAADRTDAVDRLSSIVARCAETMGGACVQLIADAQASLDQLEADIAALQRTLNDRRARIDRLNNLVRQLDAAGAVGTKRFVELR